MMENEFDLTGRPVVVVTGASAGIGRATALAFARNGYAVGLVARGRERLESAKRAVEEIGSEACIVQADVADAHAVESAADQVASRFGRLDVWVNNAMATVFGPVSRLTSDEIRRVTEVTYLGQVHGTLAALRHMRRTDQGTIVQIGSALSYRSIPLQSAYCAAKAAVRGFTDSLRSELEHDGSGIRITMVQLPAVDTPQFDWARNHMGRRLQPVPPIHEPETVADAIVRAAEEAPRELWVGAPSIQAILGTMIAPGLLDGMMARRAWDGQMTDAAAAPRKDNLFEAPEGDPGSRGRFASRAKTHAVAVSGTAVRGALVSTAAGCLAGAAALGWLLGSRRTRRLRHEHASRRAARGMRPVLSR
jgi:short-subunit dehydrogenase